MAVELERFITDQLEQLPTNHPDRVFLQEELDRIVEHKHKKYIDSMDPLKEELAKDPAVIEITDRIKTLVKEDNQIQYPKLEGRIPASHMKKNRIMANKIMKDIGNQSIVGLLPEDSRLFARVVNSLHRRAHVFTKRDLIDFPREGVTKLKETGSRTYPFIYTMQDLAVAEFNAKQRIYSNVPKNISIDHT